MTTTRELCRLLSATLPKISPRSKSRPWTWRRPSKNPPLSPLSRLHRRKGPFPALRHPPKATRPPQRRLAKRFGDASAARKARRNLTELGVTGKDLQRSIKRAHPLGGIPLKHRGRFLRLLTARERVSLALANHWYRETYLQP